MTATTGEMSSELRALLLQQQDLGEDITRLRDNFKKLSIPRRTEEKYNEISTNLDDLFAKFSGNNGKIEEIDVDKSSECICQGHLYRH